MLFRSYNVPAVMDSSAVTAQQRVHTDTSRLPSLRHTTSTNPEKPNNNPHH